MSCTITRYECASQAAEVAELAAAANAQQAANAGFHAEVQPWKSRCSDATDVHWVASRPDRRLCGWLSAGFSERHGQKYGLIYYIGRNRVIGPAGFGLQLHNAFIAEAEARGVDFVYLFPLNDTVAEMYKRAEWGYSAPHPSIVHLFRVIRAPPSEDFLEEYYPPTVRSLLNSIYELALVEPADIYLRRLVIAARRYLLEDPEKVREFTTLAEMVFGSLGDSEILTMFRNQLKESLAEFITAKGGVLPREVKPVKRGGIRRRTLRLGRRLLRRHQQRHHRKGSLKH